MTGCSDKAHENQGKSVTGDRKGKKRACYRCIWPSVLPGASGRCEDMGVWGVVTGTVGTGMASEVIKLLLGTDGTSLTCVPFHRD